MLSNIYQRLFIHILQLLLIFPQYLLANCNSRNFALNKSSPWSDCQCAMGIGADRGETVRLTCLHMDWAQMPKLGGEGLWQREDSSATNHPAMATQQQQYESNFSPPSLGALTIRGTRIGQLGQDVFRTETALQLLEMAGNSIDTVSANAFRGLEFFHGQLTQLDLSSNRLQQIPSWAFTYLRQLQVLKMEANRIQNIETDTFAEAHLANLRYFHLDQNRIGALPNGSLAHLPVLQVLTLSGNRIRSMEPGALPRNLWFLDLKDNLLPSIFFSALSGLTGLKMLDMERNNITELVTLSNGEQQQQQPIETELDLKLAHNRIRVLPEGAFDGFRRFSRLDLSHNQISSISEKAFRSVQALSSLDLSSNQIVQIPQNAFLRFAHSLRRLNLAQNELAQLPAGLRPLIGLRQLNLDGNQLKELDEPTLKGLKGNLSELSLARNGLERIPSEALQGMSLRLLDLSRNSIGQIGKMAFGSSEGFGQNGGVNSLQRLGMAGNRIRELADPGAFLYLGQLTHLDLSHNQIRRITKATLERLESLESLSMDHNQMLEFPRNALSSLMRLRQLSLEANRLSMLPNYAFQWLVHLQKLNLGRNRLHTLNAKTFHSTSAIQIKWLSLANNRISRMETAAFLNLPNLEQLLLHHNRLNVLQTQIISSLKNLRHLTLAHNLINETQESAFANLPQLESLSLAHNRLRTIKEGVFHKVPSLARLDFSHNRIEAFDLDFLGASVHQLRMLDLSHNLIRKLEIQPAKGTLKMLNLRNNQLEFIHGLMLQGFEELRRVDLSHNDLIEVNAGAFWGSGRLEEIILAENNLRHIWKETFRDQQMIHLLDLSGNVLHSLESSVFGSDNLLELDLSRNNFSAIPVRALASVRGSLCRLNLARNGLKGLDRRDFEGMHNLTVLELALNRIEALEEEVFSLLPGLRRLDLSANPVSSWSPHTFLGISPSLANLDVSNSGLFSLPRLRSPSLISLNLSGNFLYELSPSDLDPLPALQVLDLSSNRLTELRAQLFEKMADLRMLNLSGNGLTALGEELFEAMPQLEELILARMPQLVHLPQAPAWAKLGRLRSLELYSIPALAQPSTNIGQILLFLPPLHSLHFESREPLFTGSELAKADLRLLRRLVITGEGIHRLDPSAFARLRGFRLELTIGGTQLRQFPMEAIANIHAVSNLRLSLPNNLIRSLANPFGLKPPPVLNQRGTVLESLDLQGNPLVCDCQMRWIGQWLANADPNEAEKLALSECHRGSESLGAVELEEWRTRPKTGGKSKTAPNLLEWAKRVWAEMEEEGAAGGGGGLAGGSGTEGCGSRGGIERNGAEQTGWGRYGFWLYSLHPWISIVAILLVSRIWHR